MLVFKVQSLDASLASVRYRAMLPRFGLEQRGVASRLCADAAKVDLEGTSVLVFVKSFTPADLVLAQEARRRGVPVVLDLCDNIFIDSYSAKDAAGPAEMFVAMARLAAAIVTTGAALSAVVREHVAASVPIFEIPDAAESDAFLRSIRHFWPRISWGSVSRPQLLTSARVKGTLLMVRNRATPRYVVKTALRTYGGVKKQTRRALVNLKGWAILVRNRLTPSYARKLVLRSIGSMKVGIRERLRPPPRLPTVVWFGNHGAAHAQFGMLDLLPIADALAAVCARHPFELVVVSNNREKFERHIDVLPLPTRYVEWSTGRARREIEAAKAVLIPNSGDPFSICKSANRAILALSLGTPVVATKTPALEPFAGSVAFADWEASLSRYLEDGAAARADVARGQAVIAAEYEVGHIAQKWTEVIAQVSKGVPAAAENETTGRKLVVFAHLIQDVDIVLTIVGACQRQSAVSIEIWVARSLLEKSKRAWPAFESLGAAITVIEDEAIEELTFAGRDVAALLTISESSLNPHRLAHTLTRRANEAGVPTFTWQHGLENVGLTYTDEVQPAGEVSFEARHVLLWGPLRTVLPEVSATTRRKLVEVGRPRWAVSGAAPALALEGTRAVIGIFENLHWHRYDNDYRQRFIADLVAAAEAASDVTFFVRPHPAGLWFTSRRSLPFTGRPNIVIADPRSPAWARLDVAQILAAVDGAITTPSTVALDAAQLGKPVAVACYGLELGKYEPLPMLRGSTDWLSFCHGVRDGASASFVAAGRAFVDDHVLPGDAVQRFLALLEPARGASAA